VSIVCSRVAHLVVALDIELNLLARKGSDPATRSQRLSQTLRREAHLMSILAMSPALNGKKSALVNS